MWQLNNGHFLAQVAGYACSVDFSPEMSYLISGDADGKLYIWDWKTTKLYSKFKAHDDVCISALWHPHETSKIATAGWDGVIKYWDWENQPKDKYFIVIKCRKFYILWIFHMYPVMLLKYCLTRTRKHVMVAKGKKTMYVDAIDMCLAFTNPAELHSD